MYDGEKLLRACIVALTAPLPREKRRHLRGRLRDRLEVARCRAADCVVVSRAKSGRTWLRAMLSHLYQYRYGLPPDSLLEFDNFHRIDRRIPTVSFTHGQGLAAALDAAADLQAKPTIFLVRHPCDVAVSEYFQSTRRAKAHKRELHGVEEDQPMFDFVMTGSLGLPAIVDYMNAWRRRLEGMERTHIVSYEDLQTDPHGELGRIAEFLGMPFTPEEIAYAVDQASFARLKEKERTNYYHNTRLAPRDPDDPDSYKVRRAKVGGYRDYFDTRQQQAMDDYIRRHLDPAFGYDGPAGAGAPAATAPGTGD